MIDVIEGSAADKAGLKSDDVIVEFEGEKIETAKQLDKIVEDMDEGSDVQFKALRDGEEISLSATLEEMEKDGYSYGISGEGEGDNFIWQFSDGEEGTVSWFSDDDIEKEIVVDNVHVGPVNVFKNGFSKGGFLGIEGENISDQLKEYFETEHGVLIEKVLKDTPAEKAGLMAGDVITFIEGRKIEDYSDLIRTLNYYNPNENVEIQYIRKGSEENVDVTLAEKKARSFFFGKDGDETIIERDGLPRIKVQGFDGLDMPHFKGKHRVFYII